LQHLVADVVGYSRPMGEDEAGTARTAREHREAARPIVADHRGRIVKTTGDGLLLEFPSVVAAVECAIAIQKLMVERNAGRPEAKRIVYRIGVTRTSTMAQFFGGLDAARAVNNDVALADQHRHREAHGLDVVGDLLDMSGVELAHHVLGHLQVRDCKCLQFHRRQQIVAARIADGS
jgi:hypothetical protein